MSIIKLETKQTGQAWSVIIIIRNSVTYSNTGRERTFDFFLLFFFAIVQMIAEKIQSYLEISYVFFDSTINFSHK